MSSSEERITVADLLESGGQQQASLIFTNDSGDGADSDEEEAQGEMRSELYSLSVNAEVAQSIEEYQEETPDEIECQLIQKNVLINGIVQTIDFIMCNQCTRLFRTENLLWNHIKVKHKRRSYRRSTVSPPKRSAPVPPPIRPVRLEPGELAPHSAPFVVGDDDEERDEDSDVIPVQIFVDPVTYEEDNEETEGQYQNHQAGNIAAEDQDLSRVQHLAPDSQTKEKNIYVVGVEKTGNRIGSQIKGEESHTRRISGEQQMFSCPLCYGTVFPFKRQFDYHMKKEHQLGFTECNECGKKVLDLKRHREVSHRKFRVFECSHCDDKFCSQEDLYRHLRNVEVRNRVSGDAKEDMVPPPLGEFEEGEEEVMDEPEPSPEDSAVQKFVKELESKTFTCFDCGLRTPSRMTYMQHVLNGCIMDSAQVDTKSKPGRKKRKQKVVEHVLVEHGNGKKQRVELSYGALRPEESSPP